MWFVFALLSAVFAALTSVLAKVGIEGVNSNLATALRTCVVLAMATLIRWRNSGKLPFFKLSGKIYFWASDVYKFLREECLNEDFISDSINS